MKKGDWVLVPEWGGTFSIYELTDDNVTLASDESIELPTFKFKSNLAIV